MNFHANSESLYLILIYRWFFSQRKKERSQPEDDGDSLKDKSMCVQDDQSCAGKDSILSNVEIADLKICTQ